MTKIPTPPTFGEGKSWLLDTITISLADDKEMTIMIPKGMPVAKYLHEYYWKVHSNAGMILKQLRAANIPIDGYVLVDKHNKIFGTGTCPQDTTAQEIAWVACMFAEMQELRLALAFEKNE